MTLQNGMRMYTYVLCTSFDLCVFNGVNYGILVVF